MHTWKLWIILLLPTPALHWWWGTQWVIFPAFVIGCAVTLAFMVTVGWRKVEIR